MTTLTRQLTDAEWTAPQQAAPPAHELRAAADAAKIEADRLLRADRQAATRIAANLRRCGRHFDSDYCRARARQIGGNVHLIADGDFARAAADFRRAIALFKRADAPIAAAQTAIGLFAALASQNRYEEAQQVAERAAATLQAAGQMFDWARLQNNLAWLHAKHGDDRQALQLLENARRVYAAAEPPDRQRLGGIELNRANALRHLGGFQQALDAGRAAAAHFEVTGQPIERARAIEGQATTHALLGNLRHALLLFEDARDLYLGDGRHWDVCVLDLFANELLLTLNRYSQVRERFDRLQVEFERRGALAQQVELLLQTAAAEAQLGSQAAALQLLNQAYARLGAKDDRPLLLRLMLLHADLLNHMQQWEAALALIDRAEAQLGDGATPTLTTRLYLSRARALLGTGQTPAASDALDRADKLAAAHRLRDRQIAIAHLRSRLHESERRPELALAALDAAIERLEQLSGQLHVEWRADYLGDKADLFADAVRLTLRLDRPLHAWRYAERARSRALVDLLHGRVEVQFESVPSVPAAQIAELNRLLRGRDVLLRTRRLMRLPNDLRPAQSGEQLAALEAEISRQRERLLLSDAAGRQPAALLYPAAQIEPPPLADSRALIEYFVDDRRIVAFVIHAGRVKAHRLPIAPERIMQLHEFWQLNLASLAGADDQQRQALAANANRLLAHLYDGLVRPLMPLPPAINHLIIVPHAMLHYLPFHALYDGRQPLLAHVTVSYLPGAGVLQALPASTATAGAAVIGYDDGGLLPFAEREAKRVAARFGVEPIVGKHATRERLRTMGDCRLLHLATHGDFRDDSPLFSGLALADGQLTTLDVYSLKLRASLVTLSACQTGRSTIGGGDELLGLAHAFFYAGARSLLLTLWPVHDEATATLIDHFYRRLAAGERKDIALQQAQLQLRRTERWRHPYFWAGMLLIGAADSL